RSRPSAPPRSRGGPTPRRGGRTRSRSGGRPRSAASLGDPRGGGPPLRRTEGIWPPWVLEPVVKSIPLGTFARFRPPEGVVRPKRSCSREFSSESTGKGARSSLLGLHAEVVHGEPVSPRLRRDAGEADAERGSARAERRREDRPLPGTRVRGAL